MADEDAFAEGDVGAVFDVDFAYEAGAVAGVEGGEGGVRRVEGPNGVGVVGEGVQAALGGEGPEFY